MKPRESPSGGKDGYEVPAVVTPGVMNFPITSGVRGARFELRDDVQPRKLRRDCRARRRQLSGGLVFKYLKDYNYAARIYY